MDPDQTLTVNNQDVNDDGIEVEDVASEGENDDDCATDTYALLPVTQTQSGQVFHMLWYIPKTPAESGTVLRKGEGRVLSSKEYANYRKGVGKLLHITRWSQPKI
eukprot:7156133-Ditylum_brightwellii.AAC.1